MPPPVLYLLWALQASPNWPAGHMTSAQVGVNCLWLQSPGCALPQLLQKVGRGLFAGQVRSVLWLHLTDIELLQVQEGLPAQRTKAHACLRHLRYPRLTRVARAQAALLKSTCSVIQ